MPPSRSSNTQDEVYEDEVDTESDVFVPPVLVGANPPNLQVSDVRTSTTSAPQRKPILVAQDAITPQKDAGGPRIPITTPKTAITTPTEASSTTTTASPVSRAPGESASVNQKGRTIFYKKWLGVWVKGKFLLFS